MYFWALIESPHVIPSYSSDIQHLDDALTIATETHPGLEVVLVQADDRVTLVEPNAGD